MKIVALVPVKNESWVLSSYLSSVSKIADEIIALDDNSTDDSKNILVKAGVKVIKFDATHGQVVDMSARRRKLLEEGRKNGGTHFIWLDADETFSADFIRRAREIIEPLNPGQKITMRWVHAWKSTDKYLTDTRSPFGYIWKDFIVCDKEGSTFEEQFLSEARTPGTNEHIIKLPEEEGVVIHWQFSRWQTTQYKQALYRCAELIKAERSARRINHTYRITLDNKALEVTAFKKKWQQAISLPETRESHQEFYEQIMQNFNTYGIQFFEPLQIWHIPELHQMFLREVGREPKVKTFPNWLLKLNSLRKKVC